MMSVLYSYSSNIVYAERHSTEALRLNPDYEQAWCHQGYMQRSQGKYDAAIESFDQCILRNAKNVNALNGLGNIYRETGNINLAEKNFRKAIKIEPKNFETLSFLGNVFLEKCLFDKAIKCYKKSIKHNENYVDAHYNLGCAYQGLGNHEAAIRYYKQAKALNPSATQPISAIANSLEKQGKNDEALKQLAPLIKTQNPSSDIVTTYAKICLNTGSYPDGIRAINTFLDTESNTAVSPILLQELKFQLGDLYNKTGEYDKAMQQYNESNNMRPFQYDSAAVERSFKSIENHFTLDKKADTPTSNNKSKVPIFIVGMPRSGTSLIEQILASHSNVVGAGELSYISDMVNQNTFNHGKPVSYPEMVKHVDEKFLTEQSKTYLNQLRKHAKKANHITDKMPHNFMFVGLIRQLFPECKIIHCLRDPLDVCLSIYFHNFNSNHPYSDNLKNLGHYYNLYRGLMEHWMKFDTNDIFEISYESLLKNPEKNVREMLSFLDISWEDDCLKFYENKRTVSTPSYTQVRQPLYKSSMRRWRNYLSHIPELRDSINEKYILD